MNQAEIEKRTIAKLAAAYLNQRTAAAVVEGDIFVSSWGYDQTNVDFYQVVKVGPAMIALREIAKKVSRRAGDTDYVTPVANRFTGPVLTKKLLDWEGRAYVKLTSYSRAYKWDGREMSQTGGSGGH